MRYLLVMAALLLGSQGGLAAQTAGGGTARIEIKPVLELKVEPVEDAPVAPVVHGAERWWQAEGAVVVRVSANARWRLVARVAEGAGGAGELLWRVRTPASGPVEWVQGGYVPARAGVEVARGTAGRDLTLVLDYRWKQSKRGGGLLFTLEPI